MTVEIPTEYWTGKENLKAECPWLVPGAIEFLDSYLKKHAIFDFEVLEFGCGGSTLFFARRCNEVISFETDEEWIHTVLAETSKKGLFNVKISPMQDSNVNFLYAPRYDVILIDCNPPVDRMKLLKRVKHFVKEEGLIILDNYAANGCENSDKFMCGYSAVVFDDPHWDGKGTKIYIKGGNQND